MTWGPHYEIGIPIIDEEHENLFNIYNEIRLLLEVEPPGVEVYHALFKLTTNVEQHFVHEEKLMLENKYPYIDSHKGIHRQLLDDMGNLTLRYGSSPIAHTESLLMYMRSWLMDHILSADLKYATWLKNQGESL